MLVTVMRLPMDGFVRPSDTAVRSVRSHQAKLPVCVRIVEAERSDHQGDIGIGYIERHMQVFAGEQLEYWVHGRHISDRGSDRVGVELVYRGRVLTVEDLGNSGSSRFPLRGHVRDGGIVNTIPPSADAKAHGENYGVGKLRCSQCAKRG